MSALRFLVSAVVCALLASSAVADYDYNDFPSTLERSCFATFNTAFTFEQEWSNNPTIPWPDPVLDQAEPNFLLEPFSWSFVHENTTTYAPNQTQFRVQVKAYLDYQAAHSACISVPILTNKLVAMLQSTLSSGRGLPAVSWTVQETDYAYALGTFGWMDGTLLVSGQEVPVLFYGIVYAEANGSAGGDLAVRERSRELIAARNQTQQPKVKELAYSLPFVNGQLSVTAFMQEISRQARAAVVVQPEALLPWLEAQLAPANRSVTPVVTVSPLFHQSANVSTQLVFGWQDGPLLVRNPSDPDMRHCSVVVLEFEPTAA